jgi:predicted metal-dependent hydrolase
MLEVDGYRTRLDSRARRLRLRAEYVAELVPAVLRYLKPSYHPAQDPEPAGYAQWQREHAHSDPSARAAG